MGSGQTEEGDWSQTLQSNTQIIYKIGIYGWRKRCLYIFLLLLMVTVIINLALTVWILKVMDFNLHGMGKLRIHPNHVRIESTAEFLKGLHTHQLRTPHGSPLNIESSRNITFNARDSQGNIINRLYLGNNRLEAYAKKFQINSRNGEPLFYADDREVYLGANKLRVNASGGVTFIGSVQTSSIKSEDDNLRLESPMRGLQMSAPEGISINAAGGTVSISSLKDLKLESRQKTIRLYGRTIALQDIQVSESTSDQEDSAQYQLCICQNGGKLFLARADGSCKATSNICS